MTKENGGMNVMMGDLVLLDDEVNPGELSMPHAYTVAVGPRTHLVYFPLERIDGRPLLRIMESVSP